MDLERCWKAVCDRDASADGRFFFAVKTTGVYCRPSCPARRPLRRNVEFYPAADAAAGAGYRPCLRCKPDRPDWAARVCRYLEDNAGRAVTLDELERAFGLTAWHLQRAFKKRTGLSPREYQDAVRAAQLRTELRQQNTVTDAVYAAGYSSPSRMYEHAAGAIAMTPSEYRTGGSRLCLRYQVSPTALGPMLAAATDRGLAAVRFGDSAAALLEALRREFPNADLLESAEIAPWVEALRAYVAGSCDTIDLPLDIRATAFQLRVWKHLQSIPRGETRTYSEVAAAIGQPTATRAVARACATNPVAVVVPCHRVIRSDGSAAGYAWGIERKRTLLAIER